METRNLKDRKPKTVGSVAEAKIVLVDYVDDRGAVIVQPALVGKNTAILLDARVFGISKVQTPVGEASAWLRDQILAMVHGEPTPEPTLPEPKRKGSKS